jgi:hypothetical protein
LDFGLLDTIAKGKPSAKAMPLARLMPTTSLGFWIGITNKRLLTFFVILTLIQNPKLP